MSPASTSFVQEQSANGYQGNVKTGLDLNKLVSEALQQLQASIQRSNVIVRCEQLPVTEGNEAALLRLFHDLIQLIIQHPPVGSKLFLYIDCATSQGDDLIQTTDNRFYTIKFHTNIATSDEWRVSHQDVLSKCQQVLTEHHGEFAFRTTNSSGCLFSITLPGKLS
jgi:light-regulated signal transduction histidine kinase (bacteriophytochrome)